MEHHEGSHEVFRLHAPRSDGESVSVLNTRLKITRPFVLSVFTYRNPCCRFGKDVNVLDLELHLHLDGWLDSLTQVVATIILISIKIPLFLLVVLPMSVLYLMIQVCLPTSEGFLSQEKKTGQTQITSPFRFLLLCAENLHCRRSSIPSSAIDDAVPGAEQFFRNNQRSVDHQSLWCRRILHREMPDQD